MGQRMEQVKKDRCGNDEHLDFLSKNIMQICDQCSYFFVGGHFATFNKKVGLLKN